MEFSELSSEQLSRSLESLQRRADSGATPPGEAVLEELQTHRIELEMQNRTLRETQRELELALQRCTDFYDQSPIGYVTLTPAGRISQVNRTAAEWLRRDRVKLIGGYMNWFFDPFDAGRFAGHLENCLVAGRDTLYDVTLRLDQGLLVTVQLFSRRAPTDENGEPVIHTAITNIAKLRQAQDVLHDLHTESAALEAAVGDGLRVSVKTISDFAHAILQQHGNDLSAPVRELVERMHGAALRMEGTFRQLLEYCCLSCEELALDPVSLEQVAQQLVLEHRPLIEARRAEITVDRSLPCVRASRLVLGQVLAHALTQSLRMAPTGVPARFRISAESRERTVILKITDDLMAERANSAGAENSSTFRRFERSPVGGVSVGSPVALSIIRRAIERMNGRVSLEPGADEASSLLIELPKV